MNLKFTFKKKYQIIKLFSKRELKILEKNFIIIEPKDYQLLLRITDHTGNLFWYWANRKRNQSDYAISIVISDKKIRHKNIKKTVNGFNWEYVFTKRKSKKAIKKFIELKINKVRKHLLKIYFK